MIKTHIGMPVNQAVKTIKQFLADKKFTLFADIDHQANARSVDLEMPASRVIIFGNPMAGTKLMNEDIAISFDLPLRVAVVMSDGEPMLIRPDMQDFSKQYEIDSKAVLDKIEAMFDTLTNALR